MKALLFFLSIALSAAPGIAQDEGGAPDASIPKAETPKVDVPKAEPADTTVPDAGAADANAADASVSDTDADLANTVAVIKALQDGTLSTQQVKPDTVNSCCQGCIPFEKKFFDSVLTAGRYVVSSCADAVTGTAPKRVTRQLRQLCRKSDDPDKPDIYLETPVSYSLTREEDTGAKTHFTIAQKIRLTIQPPTTTKERGAEMLAKARECGDLLGGFWRRYGIKFNLSIDSDRDHSSGDPDYSISTFDGECRSHTQLFCYGGLPDVPHNVCDERCKTIPTSPVFDPRKACETACHQAVRQDEFCLTILHEVGHLVGLPDRYRDNFMCKDRPESDINEKQNPANVMSIPMLGFLDIYDKYGIRNLFGGQNATEFFPGDIRQVLSPYAACSVNQAASSAQ